MNKAQELLEVMMSERDIINKQVLTDLSKFDGKRFAMFIGYKGKEDPETIIKKFRSFIQSRTKFKDFKSAVKMFLHSTEGKFALS